MTQLMLAFYSDVAIAPLPNVYEIEIKPAVIRLAAFDIYSLRRRTELANAAVAAVDAAAVARDTVPAAFHRPEVSACLPASYLLYLSSHQSNLKFPSQKMRRLNSPCCCRFQPILEQTGFSTVRYSLLFSSFYCVLV